jgi:hypothetical protein
MGRKRILTQQQKKERQRAYYEQHKDAIRAKQRAYEQAVASGEKQIGTGRRGRKPKYESQEERAAGLEQYQNQYYRTHTLPKRLIRRLSRLGDWSEVQIRAHQAFLQLVACGEVAIPLILAQIDAGNAQPWMRWAIRTIKGWKAKEVEAQALAK